MRSTTRVDDVVIGESVRERHRRGADQVAEVVGTECTPRLLPTIAATNRDLHSAAANGSFRQDLFLSTQRVPYGTVKLMLIAAHVECCRGAERIMPLPRREWSAVRVMEDWSPPFPGFFLSYPSRKHHPAAIAALIETLRV